MTRAPMMGPATAPARSEPNVYTAMLIVAILALLTTIVLLTTNLTAEPPGGYGLTASEVFGGFAGVQGGSP